MFIYIYIYIYSHSLGLSHFQHRSRFKRSSCCSSLPAEEAPEPYRGTLLTRNTPLLGPCSIYIYIYVTVLFTPDSLDSGRASQS